MENPGRFKPLNTRLLIVLLGIGLGYGARAVFDSDSNSGNIFKPLPEEVIERHRDFDFFQQMREENEPQLELPET